MRSARIPFLSLALSLSLIACKSGPAVVAADASVREPLLAAVTALEGRWEGAASEDGPMVHVFDVIANGTVVREIMFPGSDHEMTNMYVLEGNSLAMTHYCAGGNQPRMRAASADGNRIAFEPVYVDDLKASDETYMGAMTLVILDDGHIEEHWTAFVGDEVEHEMAFELTRVN